MGAVVRHSLQAFSPEIVARPSRAVVNRFVSTPYLLV
jgi:hypothetical protein